MYSGFRRLAPSCRRPTHCRWLLVRLRRRFQGGSGSYSPGAGREDAEPQREQGTIVGMTVPQDRRTTSTPGETVGSPTVDALRNRAAPAWLVAALERLAKPEARGVDGYLVEAGECVTLDQTRTYCRCHFVRLDANRRPRVHALVSALADQVVDYCIPRSSLLEAKEHFERTGSMESITALDRQARSLFVNITTSGEGGRAAPIPAARASARAAAAAVQDAAEDEHADARAWR